MLVGIDLLDLAEDDLLSMKVLDADLRQSILKEAQLLVCYTAAAACQRTRFGSGPGSF